MGKRGEIKGPQNVVSTMLGEQKKDTSKFEQTVENKSEETKKTTQQGLPKGFTRTTIVVKEEHLEKLRTLAFINKSNVSVYISEGIEKYILDYEKNNSTIPTLR